MSIFRALSWIIKQWNSRVAPIYSYLLQLIRSAVSQGFRPVFAINSVLKCIGFVSTWNYGFPSKNRTSILTGISVILCSTKSFRSCLCASSSSTNRFRSDSRQHSTKICDQKRCGGTLIRKKLTSTVIIVERYTFQNVLIHFVFVSIKLVDVLKATRNSR